MRISKKSGNALGKALFEPKNKASLIISGNNPRQKLDGVGVFLMIAVQILSIIEVGLKTTM
jgi:hypothetical protein